MTTEVCPYCRTKFAVEETPLVCEGCGTVHHADCYAENGGCTIFGCSKSPADEPKVSVSVPELAAETPSEVPLRQAPSPPPPPPNASPTPVTASELRHIANGIVPSIFGNFDENSSGGATPEAAIHEPRKRTSFIILGALLGAFGAHNFYAGYRKKACLQLAITLLTLGFGSPMSWMWAVIDICTISCDSWGVQFES